MTSSGSWFGSAHHDNASILQGTWFGSAHHDNASMLQGTWFGSAHHDYECHGVRSRTINFQNPVLMKNIFFSLLMMLNVLQLNAQDMLGIRSSNYAGIQSLGINPAGIHTSRLGLDVNILGVGATIENDFLYIPEEELKFFGIKNIIDKFDAKDYLDDFKFATNGDPLNPDDKYNASAAINVYGPGVLFNIERHTFAFSTQIRYANSLTNIPGNIAKYSVEGLTYDSLHGYTFDAKDFQTNVMGWVEYGFSYATTIYEHDKGSLTGGITLKLLQGIAGGYTKNAQLNYNVLSDSLLIFNGGSSIDYGRTDYNTFDEVDDYDDLVKGNGFGLDVGFSYDILKDPATWQYEMDGQQHADPQANRYFIRFGASLLDLGKIKYKEHSGVYHLETDDLAPYPDYNLDEYDNNIDFDNSMSAIFYDGDSTASFRTNKFEMVLPTALSVQVDWNAYKNFYVNAGYIFGFENDNPGIDRPSILSIAPRYETSWFDISLPFSYVDYRGDVTRVGLAIRFSSFYLGSDRIGTLFGLNDLNGMDVYAGLKFFIVKERIPDMDNDKVSDAKDKCKEIPGLLKFEGCPDRDGDDVPDATDQCPDIKGLIALAGCPDRDGDGVIDGKDDCPDIPGLTTLNGCPDTDGDGIRDGDDDCPTLAGPAWFTGCPDTDNDSIPDPKDDCPTEAGPLANKGCPVKITQAPIAPVLLTPEEQEIINKVFDNLEFETGKAIIKESSFESLNALALLMNKRSSLKLNIDGHTDNTGSASINKTISLKRANAAKAYLEGRGVDGRRITTKGFGKDKPIATNNTAAGRAKNRRVEFLLVE